METRSPTILLVDDDHDIRDLTHALLEALGYAVIEASRPSMALDIAAGPATIDLVLTDVQMPEMNGFELVAAIHRLRPHVPVVYATGHAATLAGNDNRRDGPILAKPYRMKTLQSVVQASLSHAH